MLVITTLQKFKLTKLGANAEYSEKEEVDGGVNLETLVTKSYPFQPADELIESFHQLVPHLMMLCEVIQEETVREPGDLLDDFPLSESFLVTGIVVKESGVTLIGRRKLRGGKVLNMTTPFLLWEVNEHMEQYRFRNELYKAVTTAENLCLEYIEGGYLKRAAHNTQLELPFGQSDE